MAEDAALSKQQDIERILSVRVKLPTGVIGPVVRREKTATGRYQYFCEICETTSVMTGEVNLLDHVKGKKHQITLTTMNIDPVAAVQPLPPGLDATSATSESKLMKMLERSPNEPIIGLEYVIEMVGLNETQYHCVLCNKYCDQSTAILHFQTFKHRISYIDRHYCTAGRLLSFFRTNIQARVTVFKVVEEICKAIEKHHGRLPPLVVEKENCEKEMSSHIKTVMNGKHFSENNGPNFAQMADRDKIMDMLRATKLKQDIDRKISPPRRRSPIRTHPRETRRSRSISPRKRRRSRSRSRSPRRPPLSRNRDSYNREDSRDRPRKPVESRKTSAERDRKVDSSTWEKYRNLLDAAAKDLQVKFSEYQKNPEKHPLYPEEWKNFWNRRYKELQSENKDPASHDFKPEWIVFWIERMKQLNKMDLAQKKKEIRLVLGMPQEEEVVEIIDDESPPRSINLVDERRKRQKSPSWSEDYEKRSRKVSPGSSVRSHSRRRSRSISPSNSFSRKRRSKSRDSIERERDLLRERERQREKDRERNLRFVEGALAPRDPYYSEREDYYYYKARNPPTYLPVPPPVEMPEPPEEEDDEPLTIVSVLRILTALEDQLGSLGPKVLDLLAKALALEKAKANSAEEILLNDDNGVLFETIKEKLKGQMIAGVMVRNKTGAVKKAIKKIAAIVHQINHKSLAKKEEKERPTTVVITVAMDKPVIAQKIAAALIAEKKTDVTPKQLEILINVFLEMLKKSKEMNKMVTTNDYIEMKETEKVEDVAKAVDILGLRKKEEEPSVEKVKDEEDSDAESVQEFSDSDLKALIMNFKYLSSDEQVHLVNYVKKMEADTPDRIEKLGKVVNLDEILGREKKPTPVAANNKEKEQPEEKIRFEIKKKDDNVPLNRRALDYDDDEDYNFDEVVKKATKNISKEKEEEKDDKSRDSVQFNYDDTQNLIANIMGSLQKNTKKAPQPVEDPNTSSKSSKADTSKGNVQDRSMSESNSISSNLPYYQQQSMEYDNGNNSGYDNNMGQSYEMYSQQQDYNIYQQQQQVQYNNQDWTNWGQQQQQQQTQYYDYNHYNNQYMQQNNNNQWMQGPYNG